MAVAAYAAVVSLMHVLGQIQQHPSRRRLHLVRDQTKTLRIKVCFLQYFLEVHSQVLYEDLDGLARQIALVANEAEDIIDAHVVDQLSGGSLDKGLRFFCEGIDNVIEKIDSIKKELMKIKEGTTIQEQRPGVSDPSHSSVPPLIGNNTMVGFDERLVQIMDELTGDKCDLQVLPIVGMGGIGKTTLARNAFGNSYIMLHFDIRTWLTVSQEYSMQGILLGLLGKPGDQKYKESGENLAELGERLYKSLFDRRYLIVMDDVWSTNVWNEIKSFFPDNKNGSRIMVTSRLSNVAVSFSSSNPYSMDFMDKEKSWNLLCEKAFAKNGCPPELVEVGKSIAKSCKGLPLAIVVIGGLLSKSNMTREHWEFVAKDVNSFANSEDDEHCLKILSLSYNHLPIHLKPCFLYMRAFPEDGKIRVSELIRLWVVEGFLKPIRGKTLEEVGQEYLEDLIGRNLILICGLKKNGKIRTCSMHDLLRDLCIRESHKEHFLSAPKVQNLTFFKDLKKLCSLCTSRDICTRIDLSQVIGPLQSTLPDSYLVCNVCRITYPQINRLRLVKVLNSYHYREYILHPTKLRCLFMEGSVILFAFSNRIHLLWNLQTLIINSHEVVLPSKIWEMPQLRHLVIFRAVLPDPPLNTQVDRKDYTIILKNLQTLSTIEQFRWSEDAIGRIPNLKKLRICYYYRGEEMSYYSLHNLGRLHKLESLYLHAYITLNLKNITLPQLLKKLCLSDCNIPWEEMTIIGSLPNLEVLKLYDFAFTGPEWNPVEGEFQRLKLFLIECCNLVCWRAEKVHFPNLEHLELVRMRYLKEIPSGIGEKDTLRSIHLDFCTNSTVNSAREILEEQHSSGNEDLQLYVNWRLVLPGGG